MNYREVGRTAVRVSEIGFGCGGNAGLMVRGSFEEQKNAIERALELGVNYFDEAPDYGSGASETNLGKVLRHLRVRPYIGTKVEIRAQHLEDIAGQVTRSLDESLTRLGVDYVDFLQIHNGPVIQRPELPGRSYTRLWIEDYLRPGGALDGLQAAQRSGKARFIGFITRGNDAPAAQRLIDTGAFNLINVSVNLINPSAAIAPYGMRINQDYGQILHYVAAHGVGAAIYSPLAGGILSDQAVAGGPPHPLGRGPRSPEVGEILLRQAKALSFLGRLRDANAQEPHSLTEAAIRFILSLQGVTTVLGGFSEKQQVDDIAACSGKGPLSDQTMARIEMVWRCNYGVNT